MKMLAVLLSVLLLVSSQVFADISVSDLDKISEIVKESETRMKEFVSGKIENVNTKITEMDKRLTNDIKAVDTQVGRNYNLIIGFIALIIFAVGIPQIITALQGRKLREQTE